MIDDFFNKEYSPLLIWIRSNMFPSIKSGNILLYSSKYTDGTLSTKEPCNFMGGASINGYPHFIPPRDVLFDEIVTFLNSDSARNPKNSLTIRFGDTHIDRPMPMLSQLRNLYLARTWETACKSYSINYKLIYGLGDFGDRLYHKLDNIYKCKEESKFIIHSYVFKGVIINSFIIEQWKKMSLDAVRVIHQLLTDFNFYNADVILESSVFSIPMLYETVIEKTMSNSLVRNDGSPKYLLSELIWLEYLHTCTDGVICLITSNQSEHIHHVKEKIKRHYNDVMYEFHVYEKCKNGFLFNKEEWIEVYYKSLEKLKKKYIWIPFSFDLFFHLLFVGCRNNTVIDFERIDKHELLFRKANIIFKAINLGNTNKNINTDTQSLLLISLINFQYSNACVHMDFSYFFDYLYKIANFVIKKKATSMFVSKILLEGIRRLGIEL